MKTIAKCVTAVGVAAAVFVGITGTAFAETSASDANRILALHNQYRAEVGNAPLQWDASLQASAQQWADHLLATGGKEHDPSINGKLGENIYRQGNQAWGMPAETLDPAAAAHNWYQEKGYLGGHYTQMVWKASTKVGCGVATKSEKNGDAEDNKQVIVCRYDPPGNDGGQPF
jgi:uncharacterized protein YkwD